MPDKRDESAWLMTASLIVLATVALAVVLRYTRAVMIPFVFAIFVVSLVSPILDFQVIRLRFPRLIAVTITFLVVVVMIAVFCFLLTRVVQTIIATVGQYSNSFADLANRAFAEMGRWGDQFNQEKIVNDLRNTIPNLVTNTLGAVFNLVSNVFLILVIVIFLLAGRNPYAVRSGVYRDIDLQIRRYKAIMIAISILNGLLVWAILASVGLELAAVFGMLAFILNFIPNIGSIVATLLPIPIAVAQFQSPWPVIFIVAVPGTVQIVLGYLLEPKWMGKELDLHPVTVLLALSFWGMLWGITGMFVAVPLTGILRIILMQFETLRPIGNLLIGELPGSQPRSK
ncbi:MAG: AI-2E family transporter [Sedimentisphaerales bacterium]|nr:AI-2E family transporter [Sedimentisphaerales bacterium]